MKYLWLSLCFGAAGFLLQEGEEKRKPTPLRQEAFELSELVTKMEASGESWHSFLSRPTLETGIYRLPAGGTDGQGPHRYDEVYYVAEGRATLTAGEEELPAAAGSILFVAAGVPHRFHDIEEDLTVLVFFSRKGAGEKR